MEQLSPRKYIETKARSLPVYKCFVNNDWEEVRTADVIIMRKHNNGNVTAGIYLVDLLCLGIKETFYFFNQPETDIESSIGVDLHRDFKEIDYNLAHNIIYAGHDYALEFDISPHRDFAITQYILEEDWDNIPVIEIPVGEDDGKPHLVVTDRNQYTDALAKLKRIAGEGNYYYSLAGNAENMDESADENEIEGSALTSIDDIPIGEINTVNVQDVLMEDLMNQEKVQGRTMFEQVVIGAESLTRLLPDELTRLNPDEENRWDKIWEEILDQAEYPNGMNQEIMDEFYDANDELIEGEERMKDEEVSEEEFSNHLIRTLDAHSSNPMVVASMYETSSTLYLEGVAAKAKGYVNELQQQYPYLQISLAFGALLEGTRDHRFDFIYNAKTIKEALPQVKQFYAQEVINFWLIKMWLSLEEGKFKDAVQYYFLIRETQVNEWLFEAVLIKFNSTFFEYFKTNGLKSWPQ